jgi:hypothetical protein
MSLGKISYAYLNFIQYAWLRITVDLSFLSLESECYFTSVISGLSCSPIPFSTYFLHSEAVRLRSCKWLRIEID